MRKFKDFFRKAWAFHKGKIIAGLIIVPVLALAVPTYNLLVRPLWPVHWTEEHVDRLVDAMAWGFYAQQFRLGHEDFLDDAVLLIEIIETNSPFLDLMYYDADIDFRAKGQAFLDDIVGRPAVAPIGHGSLLSLIDNIYFREARGIGSFHRFQDNLTDRWWISMVVYPYAVGTPLVDHLRLHFDIDGMRDLFNMPRMNMSFAENFHRPPENITTEILQGVVGMISITFLSDIFNEDDKAKLDYIFNATDELEHIILDLRETGGYFMAAFENYVMSPLSDFDGKIWILINEGTNSAANVAVANTKDSLYATTIGTHSSTGARLATNIQFFTLPNSRALIGFAPEIITDANGRALDLGIIPDYATYEPLETVLNLIQN